jgi:prolipoprotein diacylglyceryl transferase
MNLLAIDWTIDPAIFSIGGFEIRWYGLLFAVSFFLGYQIVQKMFKREGEDLKQLDKLLVYVLIATVVGARLGHVYFYDWDSYKDDLWSILNIREGGLASHGAAITIILSLLIFSKRILKGKPTLWIFDRVVPAIALAAFFIRIGNLFNHEIMGVKTNVPWAFSFSRYWDGSISAYDPSPRHPAQLYEALCYLLIFGILIWLYYKRKAYTRPGLLMGLFLTLLFTARFFIEFIKEHQAETISEAAVLNMGQYLSIPCVLLGLFFVIRSFKHEVPDLAEAYRKKLLEQTPEDSSGPNSDAGIKGSD